VSQGNPEAGDIEEGAISGEQMLMAHQQSSELSQPGVSSFDDPTSLVAAQFAPIFVAPLPIVVSVGRDQLDAALNRWRNGSES
jgi:hypothetical protein